jgi:hypothetical protein
MTSGGFDDPTARENGLQSIAVFLSRCITHGLSVRDFSINLALVDVDGLCADIPCPASEGEWE